MSWASGRRFTILSLVLAALIVGISAVGYFSLHKPASCVDNTQNGGETGVDCGGPCARACSVDTLAPVVSYVRALPISASRTDVIASIENPNASLAAKAAAFTVTFHDADGNTIGEKKGTVEIPPGSAVPVYIANAYAGEAPVAQAFLTFDHSPVWYRYEDTRVLPVVIGTSFAGTPDAPRVLATLENPSVDPLPPTKLIVTVLDTSGKVIAGSQTVLPALSAQGTNVATFTWNSAFPGTAGAIKVVPIVPLP